jgi:hypothetical protein
MNCRAIVLAPTSPQPILSPSLTTLSFAEDEARRPNVSSDL